MDCFCFYCAEVRNCHKAAFFSIETKNEWTNNINNNDDEKNEHQINDLYWTPLTCYLYHCTVICVVCAWLEHRLIKDLKASVEIRSDIHKLCLSWLLSHLILCGSFANPNTSLWNYELYVVIRYVLLKTIHSKCEVNSCRHSAEERKHPIEFNERVLMRFTITTMRFVLGRWIGHK